MKSDHPRSEGERRKGDALATLASRRESLIQAGRRAMLRLLLSGRRTVTADDVRDSVEAPAGTDPRYFGAVPSGLARAGIIRPAGYRRSTRPEAHARPIALWELTDPAAARRWLAAHPEPVAEDPPATSAAPIDGRQRSLFDGLAGEVRP